MILTVDVANIFTHFSNVYTQYKVIHGEKVQVDALDNFIKCITQTKSDYNCSKVYMCFETEGTLFKTLKVDKMYKKYRATRQYKYNHTYEYLKRYFQYLDNYYVCYKKGYEGDDVAYTLVKQNLKDDVMLMSSDKDWTQMINNRISMYDYDLKKVVTDKSFYENNGYYSNQVVVYKALFGDKSDGIPPAIKYCMDKIELLNTFDGKLTAKERKIFNNNVRLISLSLINDDMKIIKGATDMKKINNIKNNLGISTFKEGF